ncbi:hypothetical protein EAI_05273, partial [Harpegnathos saltator]
LIDGDNKLIVDKEEQVKVWKNYITELFGDNRSEDEDIDEELESPEIIKVEVRKALSLARTGKAVGPDKVNAEILKLIDID